LRGVVAGHPALVDPLDEVRVGAEEALQVLVDGVLWVVDELASGHAGPL
jgi:hypothetical protein